MDPEAAAALPVGALVKVPPPAHSFDDRRPVECRGLPYPGVLVSHNVEGKEAEIYVGDTVAPMGELPIASEYRALLWNQITPVPMDVPMQQQMEEAVENLGGMVDITAAIGSVLGSEQKPGEHTGCRVCAQYPENMFLSLKCKCGKLLKGVLYDSVRVNKAPAGDVAVFRRIEVELQDATAGLAASLQPADAERKRLWDAAVSLQQFLAAHHAFDKRAGSDDRFDKKKTSWLPIRIADAWREHYGNGNCELELKDKLLHAGTVLEKYPKKKKPGGTNLEQQRERDLRGMEAAHGSSSTALVTTLAPAVQTGGRAFEVAR